MHNLVIVDDEKLIREGLVTYIDWGSLGIRVAGVCATAREALEAVREAEADLVLTDIKMPGMDGIELLKRLKAVSPRCEVVFVSAYRNFEYARKALRYGAFDYVMKPIEEASLYETFRRCTQHMERTAAEPNASSRQAASIEELRLYLQAGLPDPEVWQRLARTLNVPTEGSARLAIARPAGLRKDAAVAEEVEALRESLLANDTAVLSIPLGESETVLMAFGTSGHLPGGSSGGFVDTAAACTAATVGSTVGAADRNPTELYNEASWALAAVAALAGRAAGAGVEPAAPAAGSAAPVAGSPRRSMQYAELRAVLSKRPPAALTPALLAEEIMEAEQPDHEQLAWRLFAGLVRDGRAPDPGVVRLEVSRAVEGAVARLAELPVLRPGVAALPDLGEILSHERSVHAIHAATAAYLQGLCSMVRERLSPGISRRINEAINFVRDDPASDVSLSGVARRLFVSPGYLSRAFSREMSESFSHFRSRTRVEQAKKLLLDHRYKVYEVAALVGFSDVTHFTKVFTRLTGVPPSEYRRQSEGQGSGQP